MNRLEKMILIVALLSLVLVSGVYAIKFFSPSLSGNQSDWAALGDYFGGVLNPILSFLLIVLIIREAVESRKSFLESKQLQLLSQQQIDQQIQLLKPRPELVYYLAARGYMVYAVIENIGNATAYNIEISFQFEGEVDKWAAHVYDRFTGYDYFPPKYKTSMFVGHVAISHEVIGVSIHSATIKYSASREVTDKPELKTYRVDSALLKSIHCEPDFEHVLKDIVSELRSSRKK